MSISAVIRCHEDPRILDCIESMRDTKVEYEIVVALTEVSERIAKLLEGLDRVTVVPAPVGNLSTSSNIGIEASQHDKVVLLDADVICDQGYLDALDSALDEHLLVRSNIQFAYATWTQRLVSELRSYVYSASVFYCPGAAFRKELKTYIGGHFFNDKVWWTEDAEMNFRIQRASLPIHIEEEAVLTHLPEKLKKDLRGAYKIGMGKFSQAEFAGRDTFEESPLNVLKRILTGESLRSLKDIKNHAGSMDVVLYALLWHFFYYLGYYRSLLSKKFNLFNQ